MAGGKVEQPNHDYLRMLPTMNKSWHLFSPYNVLQPIPCPQLIVLCPAARYPGENDNPLYAPTLLELIIEKPTCRVRRPSTPPETRHADAFYHE